MDTADTADAKAKRDEASVDCEAGRRLGCQTYCCHLLVRLDPAERDVQEDGLPAKGFVDKDENGRCIHVDPDTHRCRIWNERPRVCREYHCNDDFLLQVVVREGFSSLTRLVQTAAHCYIPRETFVRVPQVADE
jgi:hypothetical protein